MIKRSLNHANKPWAILVQLGISLSHTECFIHEGAQRELHVILDCAATHTFQRNIQRYTHTHASNPTRALTNMSERENEKEECKWCGTPQPSEKYYAISRLTVASYIMIILLWWDTSFVSRRRLLFNYKLLYLAPYTRHYHSPQFHQFAWLP